MLKLIITLFMIELLKKIQIIFISFKDQLVDGFSKQLLHSVFVYLRSELHVINLFLVSGNVLWNVL